jgi:hypothetical protein
MTVDMADRPTHSGFLALPAELRIRIYAFIAADFPLWTRQYRHWQDDFLPPDNSQSTTVSQSITTARSVSQQFRHELLATWSEETIFTIDADLPLWQTPKSKEFFNHDHHWSTSLYIAGPTRIAYALWRITVRSLQHFDRRYGTATKVRCIRIRSRLGLRDDESREKLLGLCAERVAYYMEGIDDTIAHPKLRLQWELSDEEYAYSSGRPDHGASRTSRQVVVLQQVAPERHVRGMPDWSCLHTGPFPVCSFHKRTLNSEHSASKIRHLYV